METALAAQGLPEPVLGLNVQPASFDARILEHLRALRVRHVRSSVWWAGWDRPGDWQKGWWKRRYPRVREAGVEVLPLVTEPPAEVAGTTDLERLAHRLADFTVRFLDAHGPFPYVQILNEVDGGGPLFGPASGVSERRRGARYARFLEVVAGRVRSEHPGTRIVTGGIMHTGDFVRGMYDTGARGWDVVAIHTYGDKVWGEPWSRGQNVRLAQREHGREEPVWVTEFGMSDHTRAAVLRREHRYHGRGRAWVEPKQPELDRYHTDNWRIPLTEDPSRHLYQRVYGFQLTPDHEGWGLLRPDLTPRPAYRWLQEWRSR